MFPSIRSNIQQLQNYLVVNGYFSDVAKKNEKIVALALAIFVTLALLFVTIYRQYKAKQLDSEESVIPPHVNPNSPANRVDNAGKQDDEIKRKRQEIACLPISHYSTDRESLAYQSEDKVKGKGGILLTKNCNTLGNDHYQGIVALPENGGYCLHLCPGGGHGSFDRDKINELMSEAIKELVRQKITITAITGFIGRHPGNTIENFQQWQTDQLQRFPLS